MDKKTVENILNAAIRAPSGDNLQPWRFEVTDEYSRLNLYNLPEKDESYYNYQQTASYIAHGAAIENIAIAARHLGCMAKIELFPDSGNPNHVARFDLSPTSIENDPLYDAIFNRNTNRSPFQPSELLDENLSKLIESVKQVDSVNAYFVHNRQNIKKLAAIIMVNDRMVFERQDIHRFLFETVRWNKAQIDDTRDGMPVDTLGLNPMEKLFFPLMRYWWFVKTANYFGLSRIIGLKCWYNCFNASLLAEVTVKNPDKQGFVQAGRAMQRLWLEATRQGLAVQPIIGLPLLIYRLKQNALHSFSDKHLKMVQHAENSLKELFRIDQAETMVVGFRIGKGLPVSTKTLRKPVF